MRQVKFLEKQISGTRAIKSLNGLIILKRPVGVSTMRSVQKYRLINRLMIFNQPVGVSTFRSVGVSISRCLYNAG